MAAASIMRQLALLLTTLAWGTVQAAEPECTDCHRASADVAVHAVLNTPHGRLGEDTNATCVACHGASESHRANPELAPQISFGPSQAADADTRSGACQSCHEGADHSLWLGSAHQQEALACDTCHSSHQQRDPALDPELSERQCTNCHGAVKAEIHLPSRHPISEGKTACGDCHNPHGGLDDGALKQISLNDNCLSCHQEKRGPFLWEHAPVAEDCSLCHKPHGSVNDSLLTVRGPALCQQCHSAAFHPSQPYGSNTGASGNVLGKNCLNCHSQIHGSNHPSGARLTR